MPHTRVFVSSQNHANLAQEIRCSLVDDSQRRSRLSWEDAADEDSCVEVRLDPDDGGARTREEVHERYASLYSPKEIDTYWEVCCMPFESEVERPSLAAARQEEPTEVCEAKQLRKAQALSVAALAQEDDNDQELMRAIAMSLAEHPEHQCAEEMERTWQFFDEKKDSWISMSVTDSKLLEDVYQRNPESTFRAQLGRHGWYYNVDLANMLQASETTGCLRALRRTSMSLEGPTTGAARPAGLCELPSGRLPLARADPVVTEALCRGRLADIGNTTGDTAVAQYTLKVTLGSDTRRLRSSWPANATSEEIVDVIRTIIRLGFAPRLEDMAFLLRYKDNEGDMCSLVESTLEDCILFARDHVLKLMVGLTDVDGQGMTSSQTLCVMSLPECQPQTMSISSPAMTPRGNSSGVDTASGIEEEYSLEWSIVGTGEATFNAET